MYFGYERTSFSGMHTTDILVDKCVDWPLNVMRIFLSHHFFLCSTAISE